MTTVRNSTRKKMVAGLAVTAGLAMGLLASCGEKAKEEPTTTTTTTTTTTSAPASSSPVTPSEKGGPTKGGNSFSPSVKAPGPQTALPGNVVTAPH
ncbi:hypothetical protein [Mycolicibacterium llatzerense]|uniref:hypothetical protein n=1 Tax=Mycolicibacterium llatzerense TaxID=280871 RepID=UPI0021B5D827|nr:hypothetical protein [Mycolicibacterium llatzerense]MCT7363317.1 hypothetical protein [Mycolicibacterium llatzerense]